MRHINLLPWREQQRREQQGRFVRHTLGVMGTALLLLAALGLHLEGAVRTQQQRNDYLRQQIADIDGQLGQGQGLRSVSGRMTERMAVVEGLAASRAELVGVFDALPRTVPKGVVLDKVKQVGAALEISGTAHGNADVSSFMRRLDGSPWFHSARLSVINVGNREAGHDGASRFVLEVGTRRPGTGG